MGNLVFQATLGGQVNLVGPNTASTFNLNVPATSSTLATLTGTETFTNKTLTSPTLTTPALGVPASGTLTNCTGLPTSGLTGLISEANGGTGTTTGYYGFKNRFINGAMQIAQRATSGTSGSSVPTTSPAIYPSIDRWYAYATGATVTVAQVAGTVPIKNNLAVTGAASVTTVGVGQRIEQLNSYDLAGSTATLSVNISNTLLTTVTWTASYATTTDTWTTKTQIATGTFTVTSTLTNYTANISIPSAATTGIEILFTVGAQTSGTWTIGNAQLEKGSTATSFDYRPFGTELLLCQRYYEVLYNAADGAGVWGPFTTGAGYRGTWYFKAQKRTSASVSLAGSTTWTGSTPTIFGGISNAAFFNATTYFYSAGTADTLSLQASSEL